MHDFTIFDKDGNWMSTELRRVLNSRLGTGTHDVYYRNCPSCFKNNRYNLLGLQFIKKAENPDWYSSFNLIISQCIRIVLGVDVRSPYRFKEWPHTVRHLYFCPVCYYSHFGPIWQLPARIRGPLASNDPGEYRNGEGNWLTLTTFSDNPEMSKLFVNFQTSADHFNRILNKECLADFL